jgi:hypothetical protein
MLRGPGGSPLGGTGDAHQPPRGQKGVPPLPLQRGRRHKTGMGPGGSRVTDVGSAAGMLVKRPSVTIRDIKGRVMTPRVDSRRSFDLEQSTQERAYL